MNDLKKILKRSKINVLEKWDGGDRIYDGIEKNPVRWKLLATTMASIFLIVISYSIFNSNGQLTRDSFTVGDFYGDESIESSDELDDTFQFYDEIV